MLFIIFTAGTATEWTRFSSARTYDMESALGLGGGGGCCSCCGGAAAAAAPAVAVV